MDDLNDNDSTGEVTQAAEVAAAATSTTAEIADELLIEEISIDGMCGVY